jgi:glycosyltransferase involved in cell wall biosynthesis
MSVSISVIVCTHDRPQALRRAIDSVIGQDPPACELICVCDGPGAESAYTPSELERARQAGVEMRWISRDAPSLPASRNAGIDAARGDVVLLLDDDCRLGPGVLGRLADLYAADAAGRVDGIGLPLRESSAPPRGQRLWDLLGRLLGRRRWANRPVRSERIRLPSSLRGRLTAAQSLRGGGISLRRCVAAAERFWEGLGGYALGEDLEFCLRAGRRRALFEARGLRIEHDGGEHTGRPDAFRRGRQYVRNLYRIARRTTRWGPGERMLLGVDFLSLLLRCLLWTLAGREGPRRMGEGMAWGLIEAALRRVRTAMVGPARPPRERTLLLLMAGCQRGGAEQSACDLARGLGERQWRVDAIALRAGGEMAGQFRAVCEDFEQGLQRGRFDGLCAFRLAARLRRGRYAAVLYLDAFANVLGYGLAGAVLAGESASRLLWLHACPGHGESGGRLEGYQRRLRRAEPWLDGVIACAAWVLPHLRRLGFPPARLAAVPNGVDVLRFSAGDDADARRRLGVSAHAPLVVQVGNRWPERDPLWLVRAFGRARQRCADARLVLAGRGMDAEDVRSEARSAGCPQAVHTPGAWADVPDLLAAARVFVLASRHETHSIAVLEAMAAGKAIVVTDIPAFEGVIEHRRNGLVVPFADETALADAIVELLGDDDLRKRLALAAREDARLYDSHDTARRFEQQLLHLSRL